MKTLYQRLVEAIKPVDISHHRFDLYVRLSDASKQVIRDFCTDCKVPLSRLLINTVDSNIPPFDTWYIIPFAYEPFWEGEKEHE